VVHDSQFSGDEMHLATIRALSLAITLLPAVVLRDRHDV
jgi:hypothetical protein